MIDDSIFGLRKRNDINQRRQNNNEKPNQFVLTSANGDINGDGVADDIFLIGSKTSSSPFVQDITLIIQDGKTGSLTNVALKTDVGYNPTLHLADFNNDGVDDILISIASGGSGGMMYYYIYSYMDNAVKLIFDYDIFNRFFQYGVTYKDYYRVEVDDRTKKLLFMIDISLKDHSYLNEIYDSNGVLKEPIEGFVNPLSGLYPIDFDSDGTYELLAYQKVAGRYNADSLGYIQTVLKWDKDRFVMADQYLAVMGTEY
nr:VCBS repeat-containing protein [Sedimentibacter sp.]